MSDAIKHECGVALVRLLKPLDYYLDKYGTALYGLNKLYLLMQKQHNRGQDGVGVATIKLDPDPGRRYISRIRSNQSEPIKDVFTQIHGKFNDVTQEQLKDTTWLKKNIPFTGEVLMGHLRYGTHGVNTIEACHPMLRQNNWITRNLVLAGNFNMTNVDELFQKLVKLGQYPKEQSDTVTVLEKMGHFLDNQVEEQFKEYKNQGYKRAEITEKIADTLDVQSILRKTTKKVDGGYTLVGMLGHGDSFAIRDPHGIRPAYYYHDDEVVVVASERPAIQTAFNVLHTDVKEIKPGNAVIIKKNGQVTEEQVRPQNHQQSCSFERIYFSRGTDRDIYLERKKLGSSLAKEVLRHVDHDLENTVITYVPNTAETAYFGLVEGLEKYLDKQKNKQIRNLVSENPKDLEKKLCKILKQHVRSEKLIVKDKKLRTFISDGASRSELVSHVYDVTYGIINNDKDTIVLLDDSIVRGTTLKQSIISIVSRLKPKKIVIVSSAPQIRFPDCYGIDMSKMKEFVAFKALVALLKENDREHLLKEAYDKCKAQEHLPKEQVDNHVRSLYDEFKYEEISNKIAEIVTPEGLNVEVSVIYQTIEGLKIACPDNRGDWYFTGNYPTPGGTKVLNKAFINFMEGSDARPY